MRLQGGRRDGDADRHQRDHGGMAEREEEAHRDRPLAFGHQFARDIVDGRDMVGVDGVAQPQRIGQHGGCQQHRVVAEGGQGPDPSPGIGGDQDRVERHGLAAHVGGFVIEDAGDQAERVGWHGAQGRCGVRERRDGAEAGRACLPRQGSHEKRRDGGGVCWARGRRAEGAGLRSVFIVSCPGIPARAWQMVPERTMKPRPCAGMPGLPRGRAGTTPAARPRLRWSKSGRYPGWQAMRAVGAACAWGWPPSRAGAQWLPAPGRRGDPLTCLPLRGSTGIAASVLSPRMQDSSHWRWRTCFPFNPRRWRGAGTCHRDR